MSTASLFDGRPLNELPDRQVMGLPPAFVDRVPADLLARHADLLRCDAAALVAVLEDPRVPFLRRLAAGRVLALVGDPRIADDDPAMVSLPAGRCLIGLDHADVDAVVDRWAHVGVRREWIEKECPQHAVDIGPLRVARYLVTNEQFRRYLVATSSAELPTSWRFGIYPAHRANEPVWTVSETAAQDYARWLSSRTGRRLRLLREVEWEYAAGGGDGRQYPWGDDFEPDLANTVEQGPLTTTPVGCYPGGRSPFGLLDMAGNVEEWVSDDYAPYPGGRDVDDDLRSAGRYRVARGGSFTRFGDLARCARRHGRYDRDIYAIGFRLAEDV